MRFSQLSVAAAGVVAAQAFLLPPVITSADIDTVKALPFEDAVGIEDRVVEVSCPGCPVSVAQVDSMLQLNFSVSHDSGSDRLTLNGMPIYPMPTFPELFASDLKLGYALSVSDRSTSNDNDDLRLVLLHLEIVEVADKFITGIPPVDIKLLKTSSNALMIGAIAVSTPADDISKPTDNGQECTTIICKWRAIMADRISKLSKGCGKGKGKPSVEVIHAEPKHNGHHGGGHHGFPHATDEPHRPYRHHHRHGGIARFLKGIVMHIFIPVLIGIMVGITASLIGMVAGHVVIFAWRMLFRRGCKGSCSKRACGKVEQAETTDDETKSFLAHQGPPPEYEIVVKHEKTAEA